MLNFQFSIFNPLPAQGYADRFEQALDSRDLAAQRKILADWHSAAPDDPELYIARYNYYLHRDSPSSVSQDSALVAISQAVDRFPDRLDFRLGMAYHLSVRNEWETLGNFLVATLDHSERIHHKWTFPNVPAETTAGILAEGVADYLAVLFDQASAVHPEAISTAPAPTSNSQFSTLNSQLRKVAKRMAQVFPENIQALNFLAVSYTLEGDYEKALRYLKRAEAIDPADPVIRRNIADLEGR